LRKEYRSLSSSLCNFLNSTVTGFYILAEIKKESSKWTGHLERIEQGRVVKETFQSKSEGRRRMGRPKLRWLKDVERDLREMSIKRW